MDVAYLALAAALWLLMVGLALGCARLGGPRQPAERTAAPKPAGIPSGDRRTYPFDEGHQ